jgi:hypothetical protein
MPPHCPTQHPDIRVIVIAFHSEELDAMARMISRYTYPKGEGISDCTYNRRSVTPGHRPLSANCERRRTLRLGGLRT